MMKHRRWLAMACLAVAAGLATGGAGAAEKLTLYVSAQGAQSAGGTSPSDALPNLQDALDRGLSRVGPETRTLELRVMAGTYRGQTVTIRKTRETMPAIEITRDVHGARPVFDGGGAETTWLTVIASPQPIGQISVFGLEVTGYSTAVSLNGSRDVDRLAVTDVLLRNNMFRAIGQLSPQQGSPSTAAVRLVNADRVQIINNRFIDIRNRQRCGLIHAVYLAHGSTGNLIQDNHFEDSCGDAVRLRDASSGNRIMNNTFVDAWADAPISDWYCDSSSRKDCTKKTPECPSFANEIEGNKTVVRRAKPPEAVKTHGADSTPVCPLPPAGRGADRQRFLAR